MYPYSFGLSKIRALGAQRFIIKSNTQMNTGPVEKEYMAREPELATRHTCTQDTNKQYNF